MRRYCAWLFLLGATATVSAGPAAELSTLTGGLHARVAWIQGGLRLYGGGSVMGYDSETDTALEILPATSNQNKPLFCSGGNRLIVTRDYQVHVVDWDGGGLTYIADGIASDVWLDPATGAEWVFVRSGVDSTTGAIHRYRIDNPSESHLVWDESPSGDYYMNWWQVSADGSLGFDFLPWNRCFVIEDAATGTNGERTGVGRGCWSSLASDNSYINVHYPSGSSTGHATFMVYRYLEFVAEVPVDAGPRPPGSSEETFHPRFASNGARYISVTAGYTGSRESDNAEIYLGKFNESYTAFDGWVRMTDDLVGDYTPDAWIGVETPAPSLNFSVGEVQVVVDEGASQTVRDTLVVSTPHGVLDGPGAVSDQSWLNAQVVASGDDYLVVNAVSPAALLSGRHEALVTVTDAAVAEPRTYRVVVTVLGAPVVTEVSIVPSGVRVTVGDSADFDVVVTDQSDDTMDTYDAVVWSLSTTAHSVDSSGLFVAADSLGTCTLLATVEGVVDTALVVVTDQNTQLLALGSPVAGEVYAPGQRLTVRWGSRDPLILYVHVKVSFDMGESWHVISPRISKWDNRFGNWGWTIPDSLDTDDGQVSCISDSVLLGVFDYWDDGVSAVTNGAFTIRTPVRLTEPAGADTVAVGDTLMVSWDAASYIQGVVLEASADEGDSWHRITPAAVKTDMPEWTGFPWLVPDSLGGVTLADAAVLVRVSNYADVGAFAQSVEPVTVLPRPIAISAPLPGHSVFIGDSLAVTWTVDTARADSCRILVSVDSGASWQTLGDPTYPVEGDGSGSAAIVIPDFIGSVPSDSLAWTLMVQGSGGTPWVTVSPVYVRAPVLTTASLPAPDIWLGDTLFVSCAVDSALQDSLRLILSALDSSVVDSVLACQTRAESADSVTLWCPMTPGAPPVPAGRYLVSLCIGDGDTCIALDTLQVHAYPLELLAPLGGDRYVVGDSLVVAWDADSEAVSACSLWLSIDSGATWLLLGEVQAGEQAWGEWHWRITDERGGQSTLSEACLVRVASADGGYESVSGQFAIEAAPVADGSDDDDSDCGCGTGTGVALLPPLWFKLHRRRKRRKSSQR